MHRIALSIAIALGFIVAFSSFAPASASDFGSILSDLNFRGAAPSASRLGVADRQSVGSLRPAPAQWNRSNSGAAKLLPPVPRSQGYADASQRVSQPNSRELASSQQTPRFQSVAANPAGHLLGHQRHALPGYGCSDCNQSSGVYLQGGGCDDCGCDSFVAPRKRLKLPKLGCGCGGGCGEIIDAGCGCQSGCGLTGCGLGKCKQEAKAVCMPRTEVNLPSSTLRQYFRSNRCNTNIWDGYSQKCDSNHEHAHGTCDCHVKKKRGCCLGGGCGEILPPRQCFDACDAGCDACGSGCDGGCGH